MIMKHQIVKDKLENMRLTEKLHLRLQAVPLATSADNLALSSAESCN